MTDCPTCGHSLSNKISFEFNYRTNPDPSRDGDWEVVCRQGSRIGWALRPDKGEAMEKALLRMRVIGS